MIRKTHFNFVLAVLAISLISHLITHDAGAQSSPAPKVMPEGYVTPGTRPGKGLAPGLQVTDLGKSGRTYRVTFKKGDEIMSGLTEFAEKHKIRNAHFTGLGAIDKGLFGWANPGSGLGQKKIEINQEAEIVSFMGNISMDNLGRSVVHGHGSVAFSDGSVRGGHWWEAWVSIVGVVYVTEAEASAELGK